MIIDKLIEKIKEKENPTVVGLDPRVSFLPSFILNENYEKYGKTPKARKRAQCFSATRFASPCGCGFATRTAL